MATPTVTPGALLAPYVPRLLHVWSAEPGERRRAVDGTLVSVDISGFTALAERLASQGRRGAEELVTRISGVFAELIAVAERHGGDVLKFRGDALLLLFAGDRHVERACGAASDMQWTIESTGSSESSVGPVALSMSAGVHTGVCHFFLTSVPHRELIVAGPAATRVFELEDLAGAGEIVVSAGDGRVASRPSGSARSARAHTCCAGSSRARARSSRPRTSPATTWRASSPSRCATIWRSRAARRSTVR